MQIIKEEKDALLAVHSAVNKAGRIVRRTFGPAGLNTIIGRRYLDPKNTNDGYKTLQAIHLPDETEDAVVRIMEIGAKRTNDEAGDSTTTTVILIQEIFNSVYAFLKEPRGIVKTQKHPNIIKRELQEASKEVLVELKVRSLPVESLECLEDVALVASEDKDIAKLVAEVCWKVGKDGVVKVQETDSPTVSTKISEGMEVKSGFVADWMATNDRKEAVMENPYILVFNKKVESKAELEKGFDLMQKMKVKELVIFAPEFDSAVLELFKWDRVNNNFRVLAIKTNLWDKGISEDISAVIGATFSGDAGHSTFGGAKKIISNRVKTLIVDGEGNCVKATEQLKADLELEQNSFEKEKIKERIARISGKIGIINVGALTETERDRLKDKIDDTVGSCLGALQEGYVQGAGVTFLQISEKLPQNILSHALLAPSTEIRISTGEESVSTKVIDSVKSLRVAWESAIITVSQLITVGTTLIDQDEEHSE